MDLLFMLNHFYDEESSHSRDGRFAVRADGGGVGVARRPARARVPGRGRSVKIKSLGWMKIKEIKELWRARSRLYGQLR